MKDDGIQRTCRKCGKSFTLTKGEQEFYRSKSLSFPTHCVHCRYTTTKPFRHIVCSQCGLELTGSTSIYCANCLENAKLEIELRTKQAQRSANEAYAKLKANEAQIAGLTESLRKKEQVVAELERQFNAVSQDLEKAVQFHAALGWVEPILKGIEKRLLALEQAQNKTIQLVSQVTQIIRIMEEHSTLWDRIKRSLRSFHRRCAQLT